MKNSRIRQIVFPLITAMIWGTSFVAQKSSSQQQVEAMTFNASRSIVAFFVLLLLVQIFKKFEKKDQPEPTREEKKNNFKALLWGGFCCGTVLALACNLQQLGIAGTSAGKTSFITTLYVVLVPICGLFLKKRVPLSVWISVMLAVAGLYCLCIKEDFSIAPSDFLVLLCAFGYTLHILVCDYFSPKMNGIALSCAQFFFTALWCSIGMAIFEHPQWSAISACLGSILYVGIFSSGVAYTLQILAQKDSDNPTMVSLLLSLESVFGALSGALLLHERMSGKELIGCGLMFVAVILSQIPDRKSVV